MTRRRDVPAAQPLGWSHFHHMADIGVHGYGPDVATAFEQTALALTAIVTEPELVRAERSFRVHCEAPDLDLLLADWLNAVVFEMATRNMLFSEFRVQIAGTSLRARIGGEAIDVPRHAPAAEPKGATLTELAVRREDDGAWHARCVVDV